MGNEIRSRAEKKSLFQGRSSARSVEGPNTSSRVHRIPGDHPGEIADARSGVHPQKGLQWGGEKGNPELHHRTRANLASTRLAGVPRGAALWFSKRITGEEERSLQLPRMGKEKNSRLGMTHRYRLYVVWTGEIGNSLGSRLRKKKTNIRGQKLE